MCFKDKRYYTNKLKEYFGIAATSIMFTLLILFIFYMA